MTHLRALLGTAVLLLGPFPQKSIAQTQQVPLNPTTIQVNSQLVFLDVTVLNKRGRPVVSGLSQRDFVITEDKRPQTIFTFEAPQDHRLDATVGEKNDDGEAPVTIFVLDLLNSSFQDFAFIRYSVHAYLEVQPALLSFPAEMMVIGDASLQLLQGPTRNKGDLLEALDRLPAAIPYKWESGSFIEERFNQSVDALQQIALQNKGVPGRKNIVWVGHGSPSFNTRGLPPNTVRALTQEMHTTTNMLVDRRISLFVIYPGLRIGHFVNLAGKSPISPTKADAVSDINSDNPFADDINFGVFVNESGGKLFYNRNDVDAEIGQSQLLGSEYYTLTYQPHDGDENGKFRQIRVTLRDPDLRAVTKTGYYVPDKRAPINVQQQMEINLAEAVRSTVPFGALNLELKSIVRHPDTRTAELAVLLKSKGLEWNAIDNGDSAANITVAVASLTGTQEVLASKIERLILKAPTQDPKKLQELVLPLRFTVRVPQKTQSIRVVTETFNEGRIGAVDIDRKTLNSANATSTPTPRLILR